MSHFVRQSVSQLVTQLVSTFLFFGDVARRRQTSYDVARLRLMAPMGLWRNSTTFFGAAALCTTKIDGFRASVKSTSMTTSEWGRNCTYKSLPVPSLHNLSCACYRDKTLTQPEHSHNTTSALSQHKHSSTSTLNTIST